MKYNDISNEDLNKMINEVLNGKEETYENSYVHERASQFIKSLQDMVEDNDKALKNYRNMF